MRQIFEFDPGKAAANLKKQGLSFAEAMTVFDDPLASTLPDDQHSEYESRFITVGESSRRRVLFVVYPDGSLASGSSVPALPTQPSLDNMKNAPEPDPLAPRPALDFSKGARGKHYARMKRGTNIVLIAPDLLDTFPDSEAVNEALRSLKKIADHARRA